MKFYVSNLLLRSGLFIIVLLSMLLGSCEGPPVARRLPHLGESELTATGDTVWPTVPDFRVRNQDSVLVRPATFANQVYIADFFFTTCPTICPGMQRQLLRVYSKYKGDKRLGFLSYTIDPDHDSVAVLRRYARRLGVPTAAQWHFATAQRDTVFTLARQYLVSAQRDPSAPGGAVHSGAFVLVDAQRHIRGIYDGTNPQETERLLRELPLLLAETATAAQP